MQILQFLGHDDPAATAEDLDILSTAGLEQVDHVFEKFDMATLIRGDGNALHIFLQGRVDDFLH